MNTLRLDGSNNPKNWQHHISARLDFVEQPDEVAVWLTIDDDGEVIFLAPDQLDRLHEWLTDYRKDRT